MAPSFRRTISFTPTTDVADMFFEDWALWAKMTFVLACSMALTVLFGCAKLWCKRRFVRRHEIADDEKRQRLSVLRKSGMYIARNDHSKDVPFGIRALESEVHVEGIYTERNSLKADKDSSRSSGSYSASSSIGSLGAATLAPPSRRHDEQPSISNANTSETRGHRRPLPIFSQAGGLDTYKPRRASHLRISSYGATHLDGDTLQQLVGPAPVKRPLRTHRPKGAPYRDTLEPQSSNADDEYNSASSSNSDGTFTYTRPGAQNEPNTITKNANTKLEGQIPLLESTTLRDAYLRQEQSPTFGAGEIHLNKTIRKANSGFEVLPAGTFGEPVDHRTDEHLTADSGIRTSSEKEVSYERTGSRRPSKMKPASLKGRTRKRNG